MKKMTSIISCNPQETSKIAKELAETHLASGLKLAIDGPLGAGKTFFAKAFFETILAENETVKSPSFTIMNEYHTNDKRDLYHLDLYRVSSLDELYGTGFIDIIQDPNSIMLIEWYKNIDISDYYDKNWVFVEIKILDDLKREISISEY